MNDLRGRVALVTGGGRDVGAAISKALAEAGASVAVNYHSSKDEAEAVVAQITKAGGNARTYGADIADLEAVRRMIAGVKSDFGGLDILVNNAGLVLRIGSTKRRRKTGTSRSILVCTARSIVAMLRRPCSKLRAEAGSFPSWGIPPASASRGWPSRLPRAQAPSR